uniref:MIT domain-containing protein n=1 Tax=Mola mola TaxID=94237 RepID=A0A3Q4B825_MOLML
FESVDMTEPAELLLIRDQYELAFHSLSRGLAAEEAGSTAEALECYRKGRRHLAQGVEVLAGGERRQGAAWDTARQLQQRMKDTLPTVSAHLSDPETSRVTAGCQRERLLEPPSPAALHTQTLPAAATTAMAYPGEQPPAYTPQPTVGHRSLAHGPAGSGKPTLPAAGDGEELLFIPSGVQMFFVAPDGQVSSLSSPGYLRIMTFDSQQRDSTAERPLAFLHVCDWLYPLMSDTPVLLANSGIYMFPDSLATTPGSFVGIVLSSELPANDQETFKDLLTQLADLRIQVSLDHMCFSGAGSEVINLSEKIPLGPSKEQTGPTVLTEEKEKPPLPGWSEKMAQGILTGAAKFSEGFVKGAEATGRAIHKGGAKIRDRITPEDTPSDVSPHVSKGLQVAKQASGGAVRVSQFLVNGVATVAGHVAEKVAPHVKKHGTKLVPESLKKSKDGQASNFDGAKFVAARSLQGFSTVWSSLETGAKMVGKSVASETVLTVKYKYGDDASQATDTAIKSAVNVGVTAYNIDNLGIKAILKTAGNVFKNMLKSDKKEQQFGRDLEKKKLLCECEI